MIEISHENLNKLRSREYEEYKSLKRESYDGEVLAGIAWVFLYIILAALVATILAKLFEEEWIGIFFVYLFAIPYSIFTTCLVGLGLDHLFNLEDLFKKLSQKRQSYKRLQELEKHFSDVKKIIEEQLEEYLIYNLKDLTSQIRKSRTNQKLYENLIEIFQANHLFVEEATNILPKTKDFKLRYKEILRREDIWLEEDLALEKSYEVVKRRFFSQTKSNLKKNNQNAVNPIGIKSSDFSDILKNTKPQEKQIATKPKTKEQIREIQKPREAISPRLPQTESKQSEQIQGRLLFDDEPPRVPIRRTGLSKPRIIRASDKFWENLGRRRIETGKKGELLVLEYERKRIIREEGKEYLDKLEHSSVIQGDGLGYDITSFQNGEEIFIEVKTTTEGFWANLIFTQNELDTMNRLGSQYQLYRVYEFDKAKNEGKLRIFKGCEEIKNQFNFSPQSYLLNPKN